MSVPARSVSRSSASARREASVARPRPQHGTRRASTRSTQHGQRRLRVVDSSRGQEARRVRRLVAAFSMLVALALVSAVAFHAAIAQGQLRLDRARSDLAGAQRQYETERFATASAAAPDEIRRRAEALGLVEAERPIYLTPPPGQPPVDPENGDATSSTLADWPEVKPHLGTTQP